MFDKHVTILDSGPSHQSVTVTERRAPTDESVRLLREMERAAQEKVSQAIRLENSPIDCVVHVQDNLISNDRDYCVFVKINGKRIEARKSFHMDASQDEVAIGLLEAVSSAIASNLLARAFAAMPRLKP